MKKLKIIHLGQTHKSPIDLSDKPLYERLVKLEVVQSQLEVADFILQNPNFPVVEESIGLNFDHEDDEEIKAIFPQGWVDQIDKLNDAQRNEIYENGAAIVLLRLGSIPRLYRSDEWGSVLDIDAKKYLQMLNNSKDFEKMKEDETSLHKRREETAVQKAIEAFNLELAKSDADQKKTLNDNPTVLLVYGAAHDFEQYSGKHDELSESFSFEFIKIDCNSRRGCATVCFDLTQDLINCIFFNKLSNTILKAAVSLAESINTAAAHPDKSPIDAFNKAIEELRTCITRVIIQRNFCAITCLLAVVGVVFLLSASSSALAAASGSLLLPIGLYAAAMLLLSLAGFAFYQAHCKSFNSSELRSRVDQLEGAVHRLFGPCKREKLPAPAYKENLADCPSI